MFAQRALEFDQLPTDQAALVEVVAARRQGVIRRDTLHAADARLAFVFFRAGAGFAGVPVLRHLGHQPELLKLVWPKRI